MKIPSSYKKDQHLLPRDFFKTFDSDKNRNLAEKNMAKFFLSCGSDLSSLPMRNVLINEKSFKKTISTMKEGQCHINAWLNLFSMVNENPSVLPQLWFGVVDVWENGVYRGLFVHSFFTILNGQSKCSETIVDPYVHFHLMNGTKVHFSYYYAVPMPYFFLHNLQLYYSWSERKVFGDGVNNLWADLKNEHFTIVGETERLIQIVLREKELRTKLFLLYKRRYLTSGFAVLCSNFDNPTKGPHLRVFLFVGSVEFGEAPYVFFSFLRFIFLARQRHRQISLPDLTRYSSF